MQTGQKVGGVPVPRGTLAKWKTAALQVNDSAQVAYLAVAAGKAAINGRPVLDHLRDAFDGAALLARAVGAVAGPGMSKLPDFTGAIPLDQLDTTDTRKLLALLSEALAVAERVDAARGRSVGLDAPLGEDEPAGCDLAEAIGLIRLRVKEEVHGAGPGRE